MATVTNPTPWFLRRPKSSHGFWSWVTTVDHKKIGILYGYTAFAFFILGGLEALVIRAQLATPEGQVISADLYNQLFSTHGITLSAASTNFGIAVPSLTGSGGGPRPCWWRRGP